MQFITFVHRSLQYSWLILLFFRSFLQCIKVILNSNLGFRCTCKKHQADNKKCNKILHCNGSAVFCSRPPWRTAEGAHPGSSSQRSFLGYMPPRNWLYKTNSTYRTAGEPLLYSFSQAIDENTEHKQLRQTSVEVFDAYFHFDDESLITSLSFQLVLYTLNGNFSSMIFLLLIYENVM